MQSFTPSLDEKKSTPEGWTHDLPLNLTSSIKLLSDIIVLSKFFLKKPTIQTLSSAEAADALISEILSLDIERDTPKDKRYKLSANYVAMAKADLFSNAALNKNDLESLLKFGFLKPLKQGEHVAFYVKKQNIFRYIDQHVNTKYQDKLKQIIDRACALAIIGFASYNLLISRRTFDKSLPSIATAFDPQNIIASEKNIIIRLIEEMAKLKPSTTHSGDITRYQKEIAADIDQIRTTLESIELELIKIELKHKQQQLDILISALLKNKTSMINLEPETKNIAMIADVRKTKSREQLLKEIDELEIRQAYILAEIASQKNLLEIRTIDAEKQLHNLHSKYGNDIKKMANVQHALETTNEALQNNLNKANMTAAILEQELYSLKHKTPWWHYGLAVFGFFVGAALCTSGIGLLPGAFVLGVCTLTLSGVITFSSLSYIGYLGYHHCKDINDDAPASSAPAMKITTNLTQTIDLPHPLELKSNSTPVTSKSSAPISTKPMFTPKLPPITENEAEGHTSHTPASQNIRNDMR